MAIKKYSYWLILLYNKYLISNSTLKIQHAIQLIKPQQSSEIGYVHACTDIFCKSTTRLEMGWIITSYPTPDQSQEIIRVESQFSVFWLVSSVALMHAVLCQTARRDRLHSSHSFLYFFKRMCLFFKTYTLFLIWNTFIYSPRTV